jgi:glycosyltransferase involved in cell wall biosynthesis
VTPLRLLAIVEAYSITGPAKNLLEFARLGENAGIITTIATFTRGSGSNLFIDTARANGIAVEVIPERGPGDPATLLALRQAVERTAPGIIQTHAVKSHFLLRQTGLFKTVPWVAFHHGYTWPNLKARFYNQFDRWSLRAASRVLTVSGPFRDQLAGLGVKRDRIEVIHNAIPLDWGAKGREPGQAAATRASLGIPAERKVILIVGRLSREKDHLTLLEAMNQMRSSIQTHLVIVGEGPERPRIEERIRRLNLEGQVTLTGQQASAEPYYGIADVAVLSSLSEGSPNALLEAMVSNLPVVATAVGGIPEIVAHEESALLVRPGDSQAMSESMIRLLTDNALAEKLTGKSRLLIEERHTPEARARKLSDIYQSMARHIAL